MRLIIAGSRKLNLHPEFIHEKLHKWDVWLSFLHTRSRVHEDIEVVSGAAPGVDTSGEKYASVRGWGVRRFPADWNRFGKAAGNLRNKEMGDYGTHAALFFDKEPSPGTSNMLAWMALLGKPYLVVRV